MPRMRWRLIFCKSRRWWTSNGPWPGNFRCSRRWIRWIGEANYLKSVEFRLPRIEPERRYLLDYQDVDFSTPSKYDARNPIPACKVYDHGTIYRIRLGRYRVKQSPAIFRGAWPLGYDRDDEGATATMRADMPRPSRRVWPANCCSNGDSAVPRSSAGSTASGRISVSGVRISLLQLILMRWRKVPPSTIVSSMIESTKAGLNLDPNELEAHYLAGGNVSNVVHALVSAQKANIMLDFKMATAIDLAGRDVFEAVQMSVNPKVINTPPVAAVAKDGIQLIAKARVTVRANIKQLVGGAGEETVLARVGEGIVSSIGSAESHKIVLENPDSISRVVLNKGLDAGTAFEILSIDIADIDVGKNIGAQLQMDQAEADKNIAQAKAEERRAMAVALEQENRAKAQDARAKVILAEAEVPLAMAEAFRNGNLGIMDYYKMKNVMADTQMRESIARPEKK